MDFLLLLPLLSVCLLSCSGTTSGETDVSVEEGSDVVLPCLIKPKRDLTGDMFDWRKDGQVVFYYENGLHHNEGLTGQDEHFKGRVFHFPDQVEFSNASIKIRDTTMSDSGTYICDYAPKYPSKPVFYINLVVAACPKPIIITHKATEHLALLQCDVEGVFPKPTVEWRDSAGKKITAEKPQVTERGGRFYITLNTTVTKTGDFYCVATQMEICHQLTSKTSVYIPGSSTGWIIATAVFAALFVGVLLYTMRHRIRNCKKGRGPVV